MSIMCEAVLGVRMSDNLPACDVRPYPQEFAHRLRSGPIPDEPEAPVATDSEPAQPQKPLTEAQFRKLRGMYFTVRHHRVQPCGHLLDQINEPTFRNCEACWFTFFNSHGPLVEVTDKAFQEQGFRFLDKMRGKTYRVMFTRFMSTIAQMKRESDALQENQSREITNSEGLVSEEPPTNTSEG
jgi:hypothetical protein